MTEKKQLQDIFLLREKKQTGEKNKQSLTIRNTKFTKVSAVPAEQREVNDIRAHGV